MELFLQTLLSRAVAVAQKRKAKTLTGAHLCVSVELCRALLRAERCFAGPPRRKACLVGDDTFDFLKSVVAAAPDLAPASDEASGEGVEGEGDAPPKRKPKPRAPKAQATPGDAQDAAAPPAKRVRKAAAPKAPRAPKPSKPTMDSDWESDQEGPAAPEPPGGATSAPQQAVAETPAEVSLSFAAVEGAAALEEEDYDA